MCSLQSAKRVLQRGCSQNRKTWKTWFLQVREKCGEEGCLTSLQRRANRLTDRTLWMPITQLKIPLKNQSGCSLKSPKWALQNGCSQNRKKLKTWLIQVREKCRKRGCLTSLQRRATGVADRPIDLPTPTSINISVIALLKCSTSANSIQFDWWLLGLRPQEALQPFKPITQPGYALRPDQGKCP